MSPGPIDIPLISIDESNEEACENDMTFILFLNKIVKDIICTSDDEPKNNIISGKFDKNFASVVCGSSSKNKFKTTIAQPSFIPLKSIHPNW